MYTHMWYWVESLHNMMEAIVQNNLEGFGWEGEELWDIVYHTDIYHTDYMKPHAYTQKWDKEDIKIMTRSGKHGMGMPGLKVY